MAITQTVLGQLVDNLIHQYSAAPETGPNQRIILQLKNLRDIIIVAYQTGAEHQLQSDRSKLKEGSVFERIC